MMMLVRGTASVVNYVVKTARAFVNTQHACRTGSGSPVLRICVRGRVSQNQEPRKRFPRFADIEFL